MKKMKKFFAVILSLAMVLGMSITAFAAPTQTATASIIVNNANGATLKYVQVVEVDQESTYGWKFVDGYAQAFRTAFGLAGNDKDDVAIEKLIQLGALEDNNPNSNAENGVTNTGNDAATKVLATQFAAALESITISGDGVVADKDAYTLVDKAASAGLYVIKAEKSGYSYSSMAAYVAFENNAAGTLKDATVTAKGTTNQIRKTADDASASVATGDTIHYTLKADYPYYPANANGKQFKVTDTLTNATINSAITVTYEDNGTTRELHAPTDFVLTGGTVGSTEFTLDFSSTYNYDLAGKEITISYDALVGNIKDGKQVKNEAKQESNGKYSIAEVNAASAEFTVIKQDKDTNAPLEGAEFTLYVKDENGTETLPNVEGKFTVVETKTTGTDGKATFKGLDVDKKYYVAETKAPAGYSLNETAYMLTGATKTTTTTNDSETTDASGIKFTKSTTTTTVTDYTNNNQVVLDTKLSSLPSTGGIGTTIFTIAGCAIMIAAAGFFFASRKKANR